MWLDFHFTVDTDEDFDGEEETGFDRGGVVRVGLSDFSLLVSEFFWFLKNNGIPRWTHG